MCVRAYVCVFVCVYSIFVLSSFWQDCYWWPQSKLYSCRQQLLPQIVLNKPTVTFKCPQSVFKQFPSGTPLHDDKSWVQFEGFIHDWSEQLAFIILGYFLISMKVFFCFRVKNKSNWLFLEIVTLYFTILTLVLIIATLDRNCNLISSVSAEQRSADEKKKLICFPYFLIPYSFLCSSLYYSEQGLKLCITSTSRVYCLLKMTWLLYSSFVC